MVHTTENFDGGYLEIFGGSSNSLLNSTTVYFVFPYPNIKVSCTRHDFTFLGDSSYIEVQQTPKPGEYLFRFHIGLKLIEDAYRYTFYGISLPTCIVTTRIYEAISANEMFLTFEGPILIEEMDEELLFHFEINVGSLGQLTLRYNSSFSENLFAEEYSNELKSTDDEKEDTTHKEIADELRDEIRNDKSADKAGLGTDTLIKTKSCKISGELECATDIEDFDDSKIFKKEIDDLDSDHSIGSVKSKLLEDIGDSEDNIDESHNITHDQRKENDANESQDVSNLDCFKLDNSSDSLGQIRHGVTNNHWNKYFNLVCDVLDEILVLTL